MKKPVQPGNDLKFQIIIIKKTMRKEHAIAN